MRGTTIRPVGMLLVAAVIVGIGAFHFRAEHHSVQLSAVSSTSLRARSTPHVYECTTEHLGPKVIPEGMAAGTRLFYIRLVNRGPHACRLSGRPTVVLLNLRNHPLATVQHPTATTKTTKNPARTVVLAPRGRASFLVSMSGRGATDSSIGECPALRGLRFSWVSRSHDLRPTSVDFPASSTPIAAYADHPGGPCDEIGVSVIFRGVPRLGGVPSVQHAS